MENKIKVNLVSEYEVVFLTSTVFASSTSFQEVSDLSSKKTVQHFLIPVLRERICNSGR